MVAALRSEFGPLPDQSMHEKTSVPALIEEIYTFLRQADAKELNDLFRALKKLKKLVILLKLLKSLLKSTVSKLTLCQLLLTSMLVSVTKKQLITC
jgi:isocitrate lyase